MADADQTLTPSVLKEIRADLKESRAETRKLQDLLLSSVESNRRHFDAVDRRIEATQQQIKISAADLELMLKGELMGRHSHFETKIDRRIAELEDRWTPPT